MVDDSTLPPAADPFAAAAGPSHAATPAVPAAPAGTSLHLFPWMLNVSTLKPSAKGFNKGVYGGYARGVNGVSKRRENSVKGVSNGCQRCVKGVTKGRQRGVEGVT